MMEADDRIAVCGVHKLFPHSSPVAPAHGGCMKPLARVAGQPAVLLSITPGCSQQTPAVCRDPACNSTGSDINGNTAGGLGALLNVDESEAGGYANTAFGDLALSNTFNHSNNTAIGF